MTNKQYTSELTAAEWQVIEIKFTDLPISPDFLRHVKYPKLKQDHHALHK